MPQQDIFSNPHKSLNLATNAFRNSQLQLEKFSEHESGFSKNSKERVSAQQMDTFNTYSHDTLIV